MAPLIRKAIFPVAGLGTRFLPATKAMPKELLPIIDKPLIQYAVEEAISVGCTELIFVTGRTKRAIEDHFDGNAELVSNLRRQGKNGLAEMVHSIIPEHVNVVFTRQKEALGLGHAVRCAAAVVGDEPALVLLADDYILPSIDHDNPSKQLINAYRLRKSSYVCVMSVEPKDISKYGVIRPNVDKSAVDGILEKPAQRAAPSNLAAIGRYIIEPLVMSKLETLEPDHSDEIQLTDALDAVAIEGRLRYVTLLGQRFDCGKKLGYLDAIVHSALNDHTYAEAFADIVTKALVGRKRFPK